MLRPTISLWTGGAGRCALQVGEFAGATYTPFSDDGLTLNLDAIGPYAAFLASKGLHCVFINGTSGESMSLSQAERKAVTERWVAEGAKQSPRIRVIAHIGCDSLTATCELARHAQEVGVDAISSMAPVMFKPAAAAELAAWLKHVCAAAPRTPFYYYHFPAITGIGVSPMAILRAVEAARIPQFRGFKFTDYSLFDYECCVSHAGGAYEICYGRDDALLGGIATGATSHIGNGFCFMIGPFKRIKAGESRPLACFQLAAWGAHTRARPTALPRAPATPRPAYARLRRARRALSPCLSQPLPEGTWPRHARSRQW